jgi:hypothetical protein
MAVIKCKLQRLSHPILGLTRNDNGLHRSRMTYWHLPRSSPNPAKVRAPLVAVWTKTREGERPSFSSWNSRQ